MIGDNGTPETPDWSIPTVIRVTPEEFDWIMSDEPGEPNPALREAVERHRATCPFETCHMCQREVDGFGVYPLPDNIILGAE